MSTIDNFLPSSPLGAARMNLYPIASSSPDLPPLTDIFTKNPKRPALGSGSNTAAISACALHTFTSATNLVKDVPEIDFESDQIKISPPLKPKTVNGLLGRINADVQVPTSAQEEAPILIESSPQEKPWQRFKSRAPIPEDKQPSIPKDRVTKFIPNDKPNKKVIQSRAKTETVSKHFASNKKGEKQTSRKGVQKGSRIESLEPGLPRNDIAATGQNASNSTSCSEPALRRRIDWTPPPANNTIIIASESEHQELLSPSDRPCASKEVFQTLFDSYACKDDSISVPSGQSEQLEFLKKRKRIELVSTIAEQSKQTEQAKQTPPSKPTTTKKKARTITELATAPYALPEPEFDISKRSTRDSLLEYFDSGGEVKALVDYQSVVMSKSKETTKPTKAKAKPRKKKAGGAEAPILLSPNSALRQSSNQDFVFGTSSQLLGDESPTTLRELQLAIQASNRGGDPFGESDSRGLWCAGARDVDGELMDVDVVDLAHTPVLPNKQRMNITEHTGSACSRDQPQSDDFIDIDTIALSTPGAQKPVPSQHDSHFFQTQQAPTPPLSNPNNPTTGNGTTTSAGVSSTNAPRPKYETFTDAQLSKQIALYGFKPIKKRQAMIALLDQCWTSKNPGATSVPSHSISTTAALTSPKRKGTVAIPSPPVTATSNAAEKPAKKPRGRPKKTAEVAAEPSSKPAAITAKSKKETTPKKPRGRLKKATPKAEVIADSENSDLEDEAEAPSAPHSPSSRAPPPSRSRSRSRSRSPSSSSSSSLDLDLELDDPNSLSARRMIAADEEAAAADQTSLSLTTPTDEDLFRRITQAVKGEPRSRDPAQPSWHEKMLLYDPVVLEDLTAWLNAGALTRAGWDGEVAPGDVKRWCEARSVTCLWRRNMRGKERVRY